MINLPVFELFDLYLESAIHLYTWLFCELALAATELD
jgi:hypothetical protein